MLMSQAVIQPWREIWHNLGRRTGGEAALRIRDVGEPDTACVDSIVAGYIAT